MVAYLDHAATTPMRPEAVAAMLPFLTEHFGNPSGSHGVSRRAKTGLEDARDEVALALGCRPSEVVFTGGGTEADNLAVAGIVGARGGRAMCSAIEHHAVLHATRAVGGVEIPVTADGIVDLDALDHLLDETVSVVSVMAANNEVGTIQPIAQVVEAVRRRRGTATAVHTDAVQAFPWSDVAVDGAPADLVAVSAHKFGGPKGVGALVVRGGTKLAPLLHGGGQEQERRSGTQNVAGIVAMAAAMTATVASRADDVRRVAAQRDRLTDALLTIPGSAETAPRDVRIAGNCHVRFEGVESEALLFLLDAAGVCASAGSACASGAIEPSHVLAAMGLSHDEALSSVRLSLGPTTTDDEIDLAAKAVAEAVAQLRQR